MYMGVKPKTGVTRYTYVSNTLITLYPAERINTRDSLPLYIINPLKPSAMLISHEYSILITQHSLL